MRLDYRKGDVGWECFDVERCAIVPGVVWVDTDSATWGEHDLSMASVLAAVEGADLAQIVHHEKRIVIVPGARMVLFNPLEDNGETPADVIREAATCR